MRVTRKDLGDVTVIEVKGRIRGHDDADFLDEKLYATLGRGCSKAVVDLGSCDWISSAGIRILIHHHNSFKKNYGELKLSNLTRKIEKIITITRLAQVFDIYDSNDEAVMAFSFS
jgi:anti-sigma B factor antagonist